MEIPDKVSMNRASGSYRNASQGVIQLYVREIHAEMPYDSQGITHAIRYQGTCWLDVGYLCCCYMHQNISQAATKYAG